MKKLLLLFAVLANFAILAQNETDQAEAELTEEEIAEYQAYIQYADSINDQITYQTGTIDLGGGMATITTPEGFSFVGAEDANYILSELWGNPPSVSYGLLVPAGFNPLLEVSYVVELSYEEDGYVEDDEAEDIDYDDLLEQMQEEVKLGSEERVRQGYDSVQLLGWASTPHYDAEGKKLHWAKELHFGEDETSTLNYDIRVLGRRGVLSMNAIADIGFLEEYKTHIPEVLAAVQFNEGHHYNDFDPSIDKVAAIGIGGLIAGKMLMKGGFLVLLLKFKKFIIIGVVALIAGLKKFFGFKKKQKEEQNPENLLES